MKVFAVQSVAQRHGLTGTASPAAIADPDRSRRTWPNGAADTAMAVQRRRWHSVL